MGPRAFFSRFGSGKRRERTGVVVASLMAILFATFAMLSFAVDQTVTYSPISAPAISSPAR
ncbi:MAG TPA: hypothetical protein VHW90_01620 [Stellaceae bacterium]|jgi:hypothetical protein|nr:hypothetical protein [Stellaceae bacterium]